MLCVLTETHELLLFVVSLCRYMPSIAAGDWWRLFSSICIHGSFSHLFSNMFALVILAVPLEHTYGPLRIFLIFLSAGFCGTFLSMVRGLVNGGHTSAPAACTHMSTW